MHEQYTKNDDFTEEFKRVQEFMSICSFIASQEMKNFENFENNGIIKVKDFQEFIEKEAEWILESDKLKLIASQLEAEGWIRSAYIISSMHEYAQNFSNLCGTVYKSGNVIFTPDGNSILSPVGNRITEFDLINNKSHTFPFENRKNITKMTLSPNATLLITVDQDGRALLINYHRKVVLHVHNFKAPVHDICFSPDGRFIAVTHESHIQIWKCPGFTLEFSPLVLLKELPGHYDVVTHLSWSPDSKFILSSSKDMTTRIYPMEPSAEFPGAVLSGHRDQVLGAWFSSDMKSIYTVSKDGALFTWTCKNQEWSTKSQESEIEKDIVRNKKVKTEKGQHVFIERWKSESKNYFNQNHAYVTSVAFHAESGMLSCGFSSGIFGIWELPDFTNIHTLSISQKKITSVAFNKTGEWIAFGCAKYGQLLVWEWQSESYILKQQGHQNDMQCLSYSPDGQFIATGGDDGKVKLWNTLSGFCVVTFTEHISGISAIEFAKAGQVVFSASLDGTVRAFDLVRYRNFRTFTSPSPVQFDCLAVDPSGDIVCAGSKDTFEIYVWSVQTGKLLDIMAGHKGPISSLVFSPTDGVLASGSWDKTVRIWDIFARDRTSEAFDHGSEVITLAYSPNGKSLASTTLKGQVLFWDVSEAKQTGSIDGVKDIAGGRQSHEKITAENSTNSKHFTSICYTADGSGIIAGGNSKYVCIYDVLSKQLLKKFQISHNLSLDGMHELLNSRNMTEAGPIDLIDETAEASDLEDRIDTSLPGVMSGDLSLRRTRPAARTNCVRFSPTARSWAAASTEGLLVYALDQYLTFDPFDLEIDITPDSLMQTLLEKEFLKALVMSFRLGEKHLTKKVYDAIPVTDILLCSRELPPKYLDRFFKFIIGYMEDSPRIEFHLMWCINLLKHHGKYLKDNNVQMASSFRGLQKGIGRFYDDVSKLCDTNQYSLEFILDMHKKMKSENENEIENEEIEIDNITMDIVGI